MNEGALILLFLSIVGAAMMPQQMPQNGMRMSYGGKDCGEEQMNEGVYFPPRDSITDNLERMRMRNECLSRKARIKREAENKMKHIMDEATKKATMPGEKSKSACVVKLNDSDVNCFMDTVLTNFYKKAAWRVVVHSNVAQLWYGDQLVLMIVYEVIYYNTQMLKKMCNTFFERADLIAAINELGKLVGLTGNPIPMKADKACRPCSDFLRGGSATEGNSMRCNSTCGFGQIFDSSNITEDAAKPDVKRPIAQSGAASGTA